MSSLRVNSASIRAAKRRNPNSAMFRAGTATNRAIKKLLDTRSKKILRNKVHIHCPDIVTKALCGKNTGTVGTYSLEAVINYAPQILSSGGIPIWACKTCLRVKDNYVADHS